MSGKITEFLVEEDTTVSVGQDLLKIEPGEDGGDEPPPAKPEGGARSEPKDAEEGKKDQAAPAAGKEKGASEDTHRKQDEKAPKMKSSEEEKPAPRTQEKQPAPKKEEKPAPKEKEEEPKQDKVVGSRNETRVRLELKQDGRSASRTGRTGSARVAQTDVTHSFR
jgi:2-oxoglutarate dehydrogenase E2 component (dihydrolipoamide succinyltransferase)